MASHCLQEIPLVHDQQSGSRRKPRMINYQQQVRPAEPRCEAATFARLVAFAYKHWAIAEDKAATPNSGGIQH